MSKHPSRQRKRESGLSSQQRLALNSDFLEDEEVRDRRHLEEVDEVDAGELPEGFEDEEISSDEDDDMPTRTRKQRGDDHSDSDEEQSIGSSVDEGDLADLSTMLDDEGTLARSQQKSAPNASMLRAVGLSGATARRSSERVEAREEGEYNAEAPDEELTVDALLGGLGKAKGFDHLQRELASLAAPAGGKRGAARAQLGAPLERSDQRRVERQVHAMSPQARVPLRAGINPCPSHAGGNNRGASRGVWVGGAAGGRDPSPASASANPVAP
jgi:hypothetical protein